MPRADQLAPSVPTRCAVCDQPLGVGPWWMIDVGQAAHERCTPWADRPFPFADLTRRLRSLRARLRRGLFAVDATLAFLERAEARWPRDALAILARTRRWQARLEERLRALGLTPRA